MPHTHSAPYLITAALSRRDPLRPECALECPQEVCCFQFNPLAPSIIAAGCANGQVALWDLASGAARAAREAAAAAAAASAAAPGGAATAAAAAAAEVAEEDATGSGGSGGGGGVGGGAGSAGGGVPLVPCALLSAVEASHAAAVADLQWLPGVEIDRAGHALPPSRSAPPSAGDAAAGGAPAARASAVSAAPQPAAPPAVLVPGECAVFATLAPDGRLLLWDARPGRGATRGGGFGGGTGRRDGDGGKAASWRPVHAVPLLNVQGARAALIHALPAQKPANPSAFTIPGF